MWAGYGADRRRATHPSEHITRSTFLTVHFAVLDVETASADRRVAVNAHKAVGVERVFQGIYYVLRRDRRNRLSVTDVILDMTQPVSCVTPCKESDVCTHVTSTITPTARVHQYKHTKV